MNSAKVTVILAIAGGLATIAFKTPKIYKKIHWPIAFGLLGLFFLLTTFMQGYAAGIRDVLNYVKPDQIETATKLLKEYSERDSLYYVVAAVTAYLGFLYWLACEVIENAKKDDE